MVDEILLFYCVCYLSRNVDIIWPCLSIVSGHLGRPTLTSSDDHFSLTKPPIGNLLYVIGFGTNLTLF